MTASAPNSRQAGLHPFIATMLEQQAAAGRKPVSQGSVAEARAALAASPAVLGAGPEVGDISDIVIPASQGGIPARLFRPAGADGVLLYCHGGGWTLGELDDFDALARHLAVATRTTLVMPRYRLAPENPFPAGLEDTISALRWILGGPSELGRETVALVGDSAGGNLAAIAAIEASSPQIVAQVLAYPVCDGAMDTSSYAAFGTGFPLAAADMVWFFDHYVGAGRARRIDPRVSPLRRSDLALSPPTLVLPAEFDVLRDEGEAFARALADAGVDATSETMQGVTHGVLRLCNQVSTAREAIATIGTFVRRHVDAARTAS